MTESKNPIKMMPLALLVTLQEGQGYESRNKAAFDGCKNFIQHV